MFTVICDNCKISSGADQEINCWSDDDDAVTDAMESEWVQDGGHYCPDCVSYDDDDLIVIDKSRLNLHK